MTTVVISQPMYFPWVGFLAQMALADIFVWLDDAQFSKGSFTNRVQVKLPSGRKWMTVPLEGAGTFTTINQLSAQGSSWIASHQQMLTQSFKGYSNATGAIDLFDSRALRDDNLCEALIAGCEAQARAIGCLPKRILRTSQMHIRGHSWERVLAIVKELGGRHYLTGHGALSYLDHERFNEAGIAVSYMDYDPLPWTQSHGAFSPFVTGLDLLAAEGGSAHKHLRPACIDWQDFKRRRESMQ
jgi:hypothetical protein